MRDPVHLDEVTRALGDGDDAVAAFAEDEPALEAPLPLDPGVETQSLHLKPVLPGSPPEDTGRVGLPAVMELHETAGIARDLGAETGRGLVEARPVAGELGLVDLDRGLREGGVGVRTRRGLRHGPLQPARVDFGVPHVRAGDEIQQEGPVGGAAFEHDRAVREGAAEPREGLRAVTAVGDELGHHRVELRGHAVALGDAAVDPQAGPRGETEEDEGPGSGEKAVVGILGVEPHLDGMADGRGRLPREPSPPRHVQLELHEVEPRRHLGDGVLHLQAGVDLHEVEGARGRIEEELDGPRVPVVHGAADRDRGLAHPPVLVRAQGGRGGLLQDLLVLALDRAVANAAGPQGAVVVAHDLDLDVAHRRQALL
jgi:hypothetical protein